MTTTESEVATLRMLFETITDGRLRMRLRGIDVTERERILLLCVPKTRSVLIA